MTQARLGLVAAVLIGASLSAVAVRQTPEEVDLSWKPKVGDVVTYQMKTNASIDMGGQKTDIVFAMKMKSTVKAIENDRVTTESSGSDFKMSMGGQDMDNQGNQTGMDGITTRITNLNGELISQETKGQAMPTPPRMEQMNTFYRPKTKVKVGDTWDHEIKADAKRGYVEAKARYTLVGTEMLGKKKVWKVSIIYAEMEAAKPASMTGTVWIAADNGEMEKWYAEYQDVSFADGVPPMNAVTTLTRVD